MSRRPPPPPSVIAYIVRRVLIAILLMFIISAVTFSIFFLVPRLAGASSEDLASRYVGRTVGAEQIHATAVEAVAP